MKNKKDNPASGKKKSNSWKSVIVAIALFIILGIEIAIIAQNNQNDSSVSENAAASENQMPKEVIELVFPSSSDEITDEYGNILYYAGVDQVLGEESTEEYAGSSIDADGETTYWGYHNLGIANVENHLNVRKEPDENSDMVGKMSNNAACEILDTTADGWAHIKSGKIEGYVSLDYLLTGPDAVSRALKEVTVIATVNTTTLKVREQPSTDCAVITLVPEGEELEVTEKEGDWLKIDLDGDEAYIAAEYVDLEEKLYTAISMTELNYGNGISNTRVDLCQFAKQFIGNPYVWGGVSLTKGADCSGFVLSVYARYGVSLPHSARAQANCGKTVSLSEVQPGDLIFYTKGGVINHVAIYIGNGQVLHASSPKTGIRVSNMYYRSPYKAVSLL